MIVQALKILESLKCTVQFTIGSADPGYEESSGIFGPVLYAYAQSILPLDTSEQLT